MTYDIVGVGEAMLRLWVPAGERLEDAPSIKVSVAGAEANVAMAAARMGARTAWLSSLPANPLGRRAARDIASHGVDVGHVDWVDGARMGTYYVELSVPPRPITVVYDRAGSAAAAMTSDSIAWPVVESARILHLTGITPALSDTCRDLSEEIVTRARAAGAIVSIDVNYRRMLWEPAECRAVVGALCRDADVVIITREDARDVFGIEGEPAEVLGALGSEFGADHLILTAGSDGGYWATGGETGHCPGYAHAETIDRIGAGDSMAAGVLVGLLDDDLEHGTALGVAMSALKLGIYGDQLSVTPEEVERLMSGHGREVSR
ncbi:sugar kinase [bacterium]|nr:sugar kinase [bacterium]